MSIDLPEVLTAALVISGFMQRLIASGFKQKSYSKEAKFSDISSYCCFGLAVIAFFTGVAAM